MGRISQGILGGFSGRVGTVVGSNWKTVHYMRALAVNVSNPRTDKQQHQRTKFSMTVAFLKAINPYVRIGYRDYTHRQTSFNAAMSYIIRNAVKGSGLDLSIDYARVLVSRGSLMPVFNAVSTVKDNKVAFTWTDNSGMGDARATDVAMPLAYNKDKGEAVYLTSAGTRASATAELSLPASWAGDALAIYLGFSDEDSVRIANSICLSDTASSGSGSGDNPGGGGDGNPDENPLG